MKAASPLWTRELEDRLTRLYEKRAAIESLIRSLQQYDRCSRTSRSVEKLDIHKAWSEKLTA